MIRLFVFVGALAIVVALLCRPATKAAMPEEDRVQRARENKEAEVKRLFEEKEVAYPAGQLFLRAFKQEEVLEVWAGASQGALTLIKTFPLTARSGKLGPKRRQGDKQIPEGCYLVDRFNPRSSFHLSLGLDYPNASDRVLSDQEKPGMDIFIHGKAASVGCLAIGDQAIEELYVIATDYAQGSPQPINVHIFPSRMDSPGWEQLSATLIGERPELKPFWDNLREIYAKFEETRIVPAVAVTPEGRYELAAP